MVGPLICGVFSSRVSVDTDSATDGAEEVQKTYWFVQELEDSTLEVQALNSKNLPTGPRIKLDRERFLSRYHPEPEFYASEVLPILRSLGNKIDRGEGHRNRDEVYSAEYEFRAAVEVDEENVKANFGLGLTYLDRGEIERANDVFKRLVRIRDTYEVRHKHLFNEFGISLRKNGMFSQALEYYHKAEELCNDDEHLFLNIARAYYESGDIKNCISYLNKSSEINSEFEEAVLFRDFLKINGFINEKGEPVAHASILFSFVNSKYPAEE